jgi:hypothetical protein
MSHTFNIVHNIQYFLAGSPCLESRSEVLGISFQQRKAWYGFLCAHTIALRSGGFLLIRIFVLGERLGVLLKRLDIASCGFLVDSR